MASLRAIRTRIKSVRNTQKITKAMKLVAAAKLRRAQDAVLRTRPYAQALSELLGSLARARAAAEVPPHPLMEVRANPRRIEVVLADQRSRALRRLQLEHHPPGAALPGGRGRTSTRPSGSLHRPARPRFREEAGNRDPEGLRRLLRQAPLHDGQAGGRGPDRGVPRAEARRRLPALQPVQVGDDAGHHLHPASPESLLRRRRRSRRRAGSSSRSISTSRRDPHCSSTSFPGNSPCRSGAPCWNPRRPSTAPA